MSGAKYDQGKVRIELFPGDALFAISQVLTFGAKKYTDRNWEQGISWGRVFGAAMRHAWAWWQGKGPTNQSFLFGELDIETGFSHLWHLGCCVAFLIAYEMRGMAKFDDRPVILYQSGDTHGDLSEPAMQLQELMAKYGNVTGKQKDAGL